MQATVAETQFGGFKARIAELEARSAQLEEEVEDLRKVFFPFIFALT